MKLVEKHSHFGGYEHIVFHKPWLWTEVEDIVATVDVPVCRTQIVGEQYTSDEVFYEAGAINAAFGHELAQRGWSTPSPSLQAPSTQRSGQWQMSLLSEQRKTEEIEAAGEAPISSYNQTDFVKARVAIEVQFGKYSFVAYDLFVKHLAFYVGDQIDVGIEILPMKSLQSRMSSGVPYYEKGLYDVVRQGRGVPAVPLVVVGVEP